MRHCSVLVDLLTQIPLSLLTLLCPPHVFNIDISISASGQCLLTFLPLLDLVIREPCRTEPVCALCLPLLTIPESLYSVIPLLSVCWLMPHIGCWIVGLGEASIDAGFL